MFVLVQVSSTKTRRRGSMRPCRAFHCSRLRATSGRSCSLAHRLFFEAEASLPDEVPQRVIAGADAAPVEFGQQRAQRQVRLPSDPGQDPVPVLRQGQRPLAAHRLGGNAAGLPVEPHPALHGGPTDPKAGRNFGANQARAKRRHHPFPQVLRIWSTHSCRPPSSQPLESDVTPRRNPPHARVNLKRSCSNAGSPPGSRTGTAPRARPAARSGTRCGGRCGRTPPPPAP
jgi:hypothetical protein